MGPAAKFIGKFDDETGNIRWSTYPICDSASTSASIEKRKNMLQVTIISDEQRA